MSKDLRVASVLRSDAFLLVLIALMTVAGALAYPHLPERVPSHWNIRGEVDGYSSALWGAFGLPLMSIGVYVMMVLLPGIDPRRENYSRFGEAYGLIRKAIVLFFLVLHTVVLAAGLGYTTRTDFIIQVSTSVLFIVLGNVMGKVKPNWFVGIRTPWTLADDDVWRKTHRVSAWVWSGAGTIGLLAVFLKPPLNFTLMMYAIMGAAVFSFAYSYVLFRAKKR